ncbi:MAG: hypothetical protein ACFE8G_08170 [Candidatus Hermodarchaeota archaeon]
MRKNRRNMFYSIFIIIILSFTIVIPFSLADVASVKYSGTGDFFPEENCSLIMTNANVIFNIYYQESSNKIDISFTGNYTIYNPDSSQNITLAAPFSSEFKNLESSCVIKVDNLINPFKIIQHHWSDPWDEYLDSVGLGMSNRRDFILTNVSFPENSSVKIEFIFDAYMIESPDDDEVTIFYDVGTSRAWNGTITERVEFKTHGKLPNSYSKSIPEMFNYTCTVSNFSDGRSFTWEWIDERIMIDSVYISYSYPINRFWRMMSIVIILAGYFGVSLIIVFIVLKIRKRSKRLGIKSMGQNNNRNMHHF